MENQLMNSNDGDVKGYILLFGGRDWDEGLSLEEVQALMDRTNAWFNNLVQQGRVKGGQALAKSGKIVSGPHGSVVTDGPFAESKEAIGGYLIIDAANIDEAVEIARSSPGVDYGVTIQVRPILDECPVAKRVREKFGLVAA